MADPRQGRPTPGGHLCRCTGYQSILDAVDLPARDVQVPVPTPATGVGSRAPATAPAS